MAKNTTNITGSNNQAGGQTVTPQNWGMFRRQAFDGNVAGMAVSQAGTPNMTVVVAPGAALLTINTVSSVEATIQTNTSVVISTADTSNARIDAIVVYEDTAVTMPSTEPFSADAINGRFKLASIVGTPAGSPVAPLDAAIQSEIGAGKPWTRLANVTVDANTTTIVNSKIADMRSMISAKLATGAQADWTPLATAPSVTASNGQREFQLTYTGVDYTDRLQPGTRLKIPRTVTPTTQCTSLNGTNQYWVDTTPAGMTFTDDFVVSAWVKLSSYADATIVSRYNGTSGWELLVLANGTLLLRGFNGGIDNISSVASYQSVPLNKWIHVTGQLDMSAFTATTTTSYLMLDGVDIPSIVARSGTNPTSLVQAGDLQVGARNGTLLFPGKIAHVAIYGAKVSQQTIRDTMNKKLAGTETNLVAYFPMDGNGNDLTANNNVLVGMNSATATSLDNPMNATEYAIITKVAKPAADTLVTAFCPSGTGLPNQSLGVSSYSTARAPYGFPSSRRLWSVSFVQMAQRMFGSVTNGVYYSAQSLVIPTGEWTVNANFRDFVTSNAVAYLLHVRTMSSSSSSAAWFPGGDQPILARMFIAVTNAEIGHSSSVFGTIVASSPTTLYGVQHTLNGAGVVNVYSETSVITAECAYL